MQSLSPRSVIGFLTMCAPIEFIAAICSISSVMSAISGVQVTETVNGVDTLSCTITYFVQILNGVCSRGIVPGIDVEHSCHTWEDTSYWRAVDASNALLVDSGNSRFIKTDFEGQATSVWMIVKTICIVMIPISFINFGACVMTSDIDKTEFKKIFPKFSHLDSDYTALLTSCICNILLACMSASVIGKAQPSDVLRGEAWRTNKCRFVASPSFSYYLIVLGGILSLLCAIISSLSILFVYCLKVDTSDKQSGILPSQLQQLEDYQNLKHQGVDVNLEVNESDEDSDDDDEGSNEGSDEEEGGRRVKDGGDNESTNNDSPRKIEGSPHSATSASGGGSGVTGAKKARDDRVF